MKTHARDGTLVLGPMLRHVDGESASLWVETRDAGTVVVRSGERAWSAGTFAVHGHHYALVEVDGLEPGGEYPYTLEVDGAQAWPVDDRLPAPRIATLDPDRPLRMAFGSCRTSVPHDSDGNRRHGVDSMRAFALRLAAEDGRWPDLALLLGDQVYADSTSAEMRDFIAARRSLKEPPGAELKDYEEYAHLYKLAWSDPVNRWLFSTLPTAMIFDDHDIRDDWNSSIDWRREMDRTSWWDGRITAGLASYWVYQHLGNLSPAERARDALWQLAQGDGDGGAEPDLSDALDAFARRVDAEPTTYRFSFKRDFGDVRLVVIDSRAARVLDPRHRALLDPSELDWVDAVLAGGVRHLLIGTSLPFLLPTGLHHVEAWDEAISQGAWGRGWAWLGERMRRAVDLEHWAAFQSSFREVSRMATEVADGLRGPAPETVTFLSGDVHFSYVAEVERDSGSRIFQAVCSPVRNPLPRFMRFFSAAMAYGPAAIVGHLMALSAHVPDPPFSWRGIRGPWFDNNLATLEDTRDGLHLWWDTGVVEDGDHDRPCLRRVAQFTLQARERRAAPAE